MSGACKYKTKNQRIGRMGVVLYFSLETLSKVRIVFCAPCSAVIAETLSSFARGCQRAGAHKTALEIVGVYLLHADT